MSAPDQGSVTGLQLDVLRALWSAGEATVAQVQRFLSERRELAPATVATRLLSAKDIKAGDLARVRALIEARMAELGAG